ncbi:YihY/virulence factor BrkB family protein [Devosia sp. RR2S18]|uniref:YihY/virulence factor BrkB family protein n=1 Tax=Devosia rhizosphaerae TaxID=3049774 RepID=UPI0025403646|nr:YihY/virulence factor BrkB family protein [Devosia sp. RR2S18]WIJ24796.1 YihY/virulence factor BrkB family protein [Devosia sp. RR2S18]
MTDTSTNNSAQFQTGRGRQARSPKRIPWAGWKDVLWRLWRSFNEDRVILTAAGVTYFVLLALVPTLTAFVSIYGLFNDTRSVVEQVSLLSGIVPEGGLELIREQLTRLAAENTGTLSLTLLVSLAIALWSASAGVRSMFDAMNIAYQETEKRSFFWVTVLAMIYTFAGAIAAMLVIATVVILPPLLQLIPGSDEYAWIVQIAAYGLMLLIIALAIGALYRWGPSRERAKWRWITPGAVMSVVLLGLTSVTFSWYVTNFSDYSAAYGSLGALIGFLTWVWISAIIIIVGAELNSEIEHQTAHDSTTGEPLPLGQRGARMADTVGEVIPLDLDKVASPPVLRATRQRISWGALAVAAPAAYLARALGRRHRS